MKVSKIVSIAGLLVGLSFGVVAHAADQAAVAPAKTAEGQAKGSKTSPQALEIAAGVDESLRKVGLGRLENEPLDVKITSVTPTAPRAHFTVSYQLPTTTGPERASAAPGAVAKKAAKKQPAVAVISGVVTPSGHVVVGHGGDVAKLFAQLDLLLGDERRRAAQKSANEAAAAARPPAKITVSSR
jgi:hypothetical protein